MKPCPKCGSEDREYIPAEPRCMEYPNGSKECYECAECGHAEDIEREEYDYDRWREDRMTSTVAG